MQKKRWPGGNTREGNKAPALCLKRRGQKQRMGHTLPGLERRKRRTKMITKPSSKQSPERDELSKAKSSEAAHDALMRSPPEVVSHLAKLFGQYLIIIVDAY